MPCIVDPPSVTPEEWLEHMLCQTCRFLTKEQLAQVCGLDIYQDLYHWYRSHLASDAYYYSKLKFNYHLKGKEMNFIFSSADEKKEYAKKQIQRCIDEAKRLNWTLRIEEGGVSID